jgi:hypothetical protein
MKNFSLRSLLKDLRKIIGKTTRFGEKKLMSKDEYLIRAGTATPKQGAKILGGGALQVGIAGVGIVAYKKIKEKMLDPMNKKIKELEEKCDKCNINYLKPIQKYEKNPRDNINERLKNLENALRGNNFGNDKETYDEAVNRHVKHGLISTAALATGISGIKLIVLKREINKNKKRILSIENELNKACSGKSK